MSNYEHLLFPTQLEKPTVAFDNRCVISPSQQLIANQPTIISPRISNESLKKTLARRAAYRFNVQPVQRPRAPNRISGPKAREADTFEPVSVELDEDTKDALDDPSTLEDDIERLRIICMQLRRLMQAHAANNDYKNARKVKNVYEIAEKKLHHLEKTSGTQDAVQHMLWRHKEIQMLVQDFIDEWEQKYNDFLAASEERVREQQQKNEEELAAFDETAPEDVDHHFYKRSQELLDVRRQEKKLAMVHDFAGAQRLKVKGDAIEQRELEAAAKKTQKDFLRRRKILVAKQNEKVQGIINHVEAVRKTMVLNRNKSIYGYLKRMNLLDKDIDAQVLMRRLKEDEIDEELDEERADFVRDSQKYDPIPRFRYPVTPAEAEAMKKERTRKLRQERTAKRKKTKEEVEEPYTDEEYQEVQIDAGEGEGQRDQEEADESPKDEEYESNDAKGEAEEQADEQEDKGKSTESESSKKEDSSEAGEEEEQKKHHKKKHHKEEGADEQEPEPEAEAEAEAEAEGADEREAEPEEAGEDGKLEPMIERLGDEEEAEPEPEEKEKKHRKKKHHKESKGEAAEDEAKPEEDKAEDEKLDQMIENLRPQEEANE